MEEHEFIESQRGGDDSPRVWECDKCGEDFWACPSALTWGDILCGDCLEAKQEPSK